MVRPNGACTALCTDVLKKDGKERNGKESPFESTLLSREDNNIVFIKEIKCRLGFFPPPSSKRLFWRIIGTRKIKRQTEISVRETKTAETSPKSFRAERARSTKNL